MNVGDFVIKGGCFAAAVFYRDALDPNTVNPKEKTVEQRQFKYISRSQILSINKSKHASQKKQEGHITME